VAFDVDVTCAFSVSLLTVQLNPSLTLMFRQAGGALGALYGEVTPAGAKVLPMPVMSPLAATVKSTVDQPCATLSALSTVAAGGRTCAPRGR
jgi:hypothetical protein